jgi:glycosyltransferase involved in cell wall biosynthesis
MRAADVGFLVMHPLPIYRFGVSLNKLFDYMSCALPVLAAYSAGNDPVREANCGLSVPAGDPGAFSEAVKTLCRMSREERQEMGLRGRAVAEEQYSYAVLAARYAEACRVLG